MNHSAKSSTIDRLPPHALDAETAVVCCCLLAPNESIPECVSVLRSPGLEEFYDLKNRGAFAILRAMFDLRIPIDSVTFHQRVIDLNRMEALGGMEYLLKLPDAVPSPANLSYYLEIVKEQFLLRKILQTGSSMASRVYEHRGEIDQFLDEVERDVLAISESRVAERALDIKSLVRGAIDQIEAFHQNQGALTGVGTGFADLDKMTSGLHGGEMLVIAARPSMGKTSLAMNIAENVALNLKLPVGVFSLEMTAEALVLRMICSRARVNLRNVRDGFLADRDFPKLTGAAGKIQNAPIFIDDSSGLSILELRAKARRMAQQHGIKLFVIDYLQLLHSTNRRADNRQQEIADISGGVKSLAKELNVPVVVLSQLNRELEKDKGRKPRLSDLRESGAIEQDADLVGLLYKPSSGEDDELSQAEEQDAIPVNLLIAKQRNGPTGEVNLTFLKSYTRFENAAKLEEAEA